ncbi:MAG: lipase family protein [Thainema sp.]
MNILRRSTWIGLFLGFVVPVGLDIGVKAGSAIAVSSSNPTHPDIEQIALLPKVETLNLAQARNSTDPLRTIQIAAYWGIAVGAISFAGIFGIAVLRYQRQGRWQRAELARQTIHEFCQKESTQRVLSILDFEEYRDLRVELPVTGETVVFEATDTRLRHALRRHGEMVKLKRGFNQILDVYLDVEQAQTQEKFLDLDLAEAIRRFQQDFQIEMVLRDWFDEFLDGLEHLNSMIEAKLVSAKDFEPYIRNWIRLIADRSFRRFDGSSFYDQLFLYIFHSQYKGVQALCKRYGYTIIPPPYEADDFHQFSNRKPPLPGYDTRVAIALAKAAYLVYEHEHFIEDMVRYWVKPTHYPDYRRIDDDKEFVLAVMRYNAQMKSEKAQANIQFQFFDSRDRDTQAFAFRIDHRIILAFRGTQQLRDWLTNADVVQANLQSFGNLDAIKLGQVHNGFQSGWRSIYRQVSKTLQKWCEAEPGTNMEVWVTGHSLGGALATLAATSLKEQGIPVTKLYTFGQPRTGNGIFLDYFNTSLGFKEQAFRFVNNTDIVPRVPLRALSRRFWFAPWNLRSLYGHGGTLKYFNFRGRLWHNSTFVARVFDVLLGSMAGIGQPSWDFLADHSMELYLMHLQDALKREEEAAERIRCETEMEITRQQMKAQA